MSSLNIKDIRIEEAQLLNNEFDITLKRDGTLIYYKGGNLISNRGVIRNDRFAHILKLLKDNGFQECMGEMYIEGGKVFDVSRRENWHKAKFMPFDLLSNEDYELRQKKLNKLLYCMADDDEFITQPMRFGDLIEGWHYVLENKEEGLILRNRNDWYKIKVLQEAKVPIKAWERGREKGTFILENDNRISGTSMDFVSRFLKWNKEGKEVIAEIEYPYLTDNGRYFQPRLRQMTCAT